MTFVYVVGDLHFGHRNLPNFRRISGCDTEEALRECVIKNWNLYVTKRDIVYVLGDACFNEESLEHIGRLNGSKILVAGNHDRLNAGRYLSVFKDVKGIVKRRAVWLSHAPIHPQELRGGINVHGHVHNATIDDRRYRNVSLENLIGFRPHKLEEVKMSPERCLLAVGRVIE